MGCQHVVHLGVHRHGRVGHQRPRGGGPHQHVRLTRQRAARQREPDVHGRVGDVLVALCELVVREGGAAAGTVGRHAVVLLQESGREDLLERPPHRLHVLRRHGDVGLIHVHPVAHAVGEFLEVVHVAEHGLAALGVERLHAEVLDVGLAGEAELLLDGELHGQAVAVPARLAVHAVALHGLEAGEQVLEDPRLDVVGARPAVRGGRALVEGPLLTVGGGCQRRVESVCLVPQGQDLGLHGREVDAGGDGVVLVHGSSSLQSRCCLDRRC